MLAQVKWFVSHEDSQQLHTIDSDTPPPGTPASRRDDMETARPRAESAEVVVVRDESGSSSCTGAPALAQSLYWLYRATVSEIPRCPNKSSNLPNRGV